MKKSVCLVVFLILFFSVLGATFAQTPKETKFGIGFQAAWPTFGISGMVDVTKNISLQAILGFFGDLKTYGGRFLYRFTKEEFWNAYGYGMIGAWSFTGLAIGDNFSINTTTETVFGFGAGAGVEYNIQGLAPKFPPIYFNLEIGFGSVKFKQVDYNFSSFMFGSGVHFRF